MANIKGLISQLAGSRRGSAGGTGRTRAGGGRVAGGGAGGGRRGQDEAIGRGVRKLLRRGR